MNINIYAIGQVPVVALSGALDGPAAIEVRDKINELLPLHESVVIDLSGTTCVSSASLRTMLLIYRQAQALGRTVAVVGLTPEVHNVLDATGFLEFFVVAGSVDDGAVAAPARAEEGLNREHALSGS